MLSAWRGTRAPRRGDRSSSKEMADMNQRRLLPMARTLTVAALIVATAGFALEIVSGIDVPAIPPGIVIMLAGAGLVAFLPWRWVPLLGTGVGLFLLFGFYASGAM